MDKKRLAFYYGILLIAVGLGVFYRIPQVMPRVGEIEFFSQKLGLVKFCFYTLGVLLVMAGGIRVFKNYK
ncbi:hypothetical protein [Desulfospira joergensenii]|uniref:hypothetical protein n=1 Tax=Desulfospira joergensenii TaxID=53329 RepID=UPI0003B43E90|nr:hypothetical protein [Desulfospira joergensenii]